MKQHYEYKSSTAAKPSVSRRRLLKLGGVFAASVIVTSCGKRAVMQPSSGPAPGIPERFARYAASDEPNGDLAEVAWPDFVIAAGPEVQRLYAFQVEHGDLMRYIPCFCGCDASAGHRNNRDCYIKAINPDGTIVFDAMAPT